MYKERKARLYKFGRGLSVEAQLRTGQQRLVGLYAVPSFTFVVLRAVLCLGASMHLGSVHNGRVHFSAYFVVLTHETFRQAVSCDVRRKKNTTASIQAR